MGDSRLGQCVCNPCPPGDCTVVRNITEIRFHSTTAEAVYIGSISFAYTVFALILLYHTCLSKWASDGDGIPGAAAVIFGGMGLLILYSFALMGVVTTFL